MAFAPWLMKALSVAGTAAMFLVGGGILVHGVPALAPRRARRDAPRWTRLSEALGSRRF